MSEAERRAAADSWLAQHVTDLSSRRGLALAALGNAHVIKPAKRRYRPRGTWKKQRGCRCRGK